MTDESRSQLARLKRLLAAARWAALASVDGAGAPMASMVGYVMTEASDAAYIHLSRLAAHTGNLLANGRAALVISENDDGNGDPQELTRVTLQGGVQVIARDTEEYGAAQESYLQRLPASERLFDFPDFILFRLDVVEARFVGGFGQARTFGATDLRNAARQPINTHDA